VAEVILIVHGGLQFTVEGDYQDISSWFSQKTSSREARQFQTRHTLDGDPMVTISSAHLVAVAGTNGD
jgi:hypothetical protein